MIDEHTPQKAVAANMKQLLQQHQERIDSLEKMIEVYRADAEKERAFCNELQRAIAHVEEHHHRLEGEKNED